MVVVDSSVWIEFLRRPDTAVGREMTRLLRADQVLMVGTVLAEVLQGASNAEQLEGIGSRLAVLPYAEAAKSDWVRAAELASSLRNVGQTTALSDLVIAAQALRDDHEVFTLDDDFRRVPGLRLHQVTP